MITVISDLIMIIYDKYCIFVFNWRNFHFNDTLEKNENMPILNIPTTKQDNNCLHKPNRTTATLKHLHVMHCWLIEQD